MPFPQRGESLVASRKESYNASVESGKGMEGTPTYRLQLVGSVKRERENDRVREPNAALDERGGNVVDYGAGKHVSVRWRQRWEDYVDEADTQGETKAAENANVPIGELCAAYRGISYWSSGIRVFGRRCRQWFRAIAWLTIFV